MRRGDLPTETLAGVVGATLVAVSLCAAPASAYLCTQTDQGASLFWQQRDIVIHASEFPPAEVSLEDVSEAAAFGCAQWSDVECSDLTLSVGSSTSDRRVGFDWRAGSDSPENVNLLVFRRGADGDPQDDWLHAGSALAITTVTFLRSTGRIVDADIEVNDAGFDFTACDPPACTPQQDLRNTLTHELGHVLGLDHPPSFQPGAESATMYASAPSGDLQKRDLSDDDVDGLCTLYPSDGPVGFCGTVEVSPPPSIRVRQAGCAQAPPGAPLGLGLGLLLLALVRRRHQGTLRQERGGPPPVHAICKGRCRD